MMKPVDGKPGTQAGIALTIMAIPLLLFTALAVFNILARRRPVVRIWRDAIEINIRTHPVDCRCESGYV
jgi:hypothetical protein